MMDIPELVEKEIEGMLDSLEKGKKEIEKKFKSLLEEFISDSWKNFDYYLENDSRFDYKSWIRRTSNDIIEALLIGDTKYLKDQWIISDYNWEKLQRIRLAIWKSAGQEIEGCIITSLQKEIEELKKINKQFGLDR